MPFSFHPRCSALGPWIVLLVACRGGRLEAAETHSLALATLGHTSAQEQPLAEEPDFRGYFPDDPEGGAALDALWEANGQGRLSVDEWAAVVRRGMRHTTVRPLFFLRDLGNRGVWGKPDQNAAAKELMFHAADWKPGAPGGEVQHSAVYFGLSVIEPKDERVLRALVAYELYERLLGRPAPVRPNGLPEVAALLGDWLWTVRLPGGAQTQQEVTIERASEGSDALYVIVSGTRFPVAAKAFQERELLFVFTGNMGGSQFHTTARLRDGRLVGSTHALTEGELLTWTGQRR